MIKYSFLIIVLFFGCKTKDRIVKDNSATETLNCDHQSIWLQNRMGTCNTSIAFMKQNIVKSPTSFEYEKLGTRIIGKGDIAIKEDTNFKNLDKLHFFYIDLVCLQELELSELLTLLVDDKNAEEVMILMSDKNTKLAIDFCIEGMECFSLGAKSTSAYNLAWHKIQNSH